MHHRLPALDGLRAISILLVLATHMLPVGPKVWRLNETTGPMGMSLFFALSGFLVTSNLLQNQNVYDFFVRRLARILPLAYLYLAFCFLILVFEPVVLLGNLLFIENYVHSFMNKLNSHFWSLCVEMHFYIAIGLVAAIFGRRGLWLVLPACLLITLIRIWHHSFINIMTHLRVDEILAGAVVALLYQKQMLFRSSVWVFGTAVICWAVFSSPFVEELQYLRPYGSAAVLAALLPLAPCALTRALSSPPARYVANVSYALYVFHPLTILDWMNSGSTLERYLFKRPISFAMTFILAHLSTFYWENRWISWGRSITKRSTTATA
jgi:peptidoglycan/LPS O-acetylase OafA/YrhL